MKLRPARVAAAAAATLAATSFAAAPIESPLAAANRTPAAAAHPARVSPPVRPCTSVSVDPPMTLTLGKSQLIHLDFPAARLVVGGHASDRVGRPTPRTEAQAAPATTAAAAAGGGLNYSDGVADAEITLLSPTELFFLGRKAGSMNVVLQSADGRCVAKDIVVAIDPTTLQAKFAELMPQERGIKVVAAESGVVLSGTVSDASKLHEALMVAGAYMDPKRAVNLLRVASPQQVMLEVKIAEVSKSLLDRLGLNNFQRAFTNGAGVSTVIQGIIGGGSSLLSRIHGGPGLPGGATSATQLGIDANKKDGIVRVLAEPNIVAISGQSASFLSGGKIFIPVAQTQNNGFPTITLEEKEFGVGLKFTPTVLGDRVNLKMVSEVSDLSQTGTPFTTVGGQVAILPSMTTRRVDTTVQLGDGQSFVVAGLIKNNLNEALNKFPGLGEAPVLGALFRSSEFAADQTELMFVVTPRLVKPLSGPVALPTDMHVVPSRSDVMLMGKGEGTRPPVQPALVAPAPAVPAAPAAPAEPAQPAQPAPVRAPGASSEAQPDEDAAPQLAPTRIAQAPGPLATATVQSAADAGSQPQPPGLPEAVAMPVRESTVQPISEWLGTSPL